MYTVAKGPSRLVQVESRLGELLKCRHSAPIPRRPRAQPPGPWPLSSLACCGSWGRRVGHN
ncbi:hypothetical protein FD754_002222 [Muntiacus muntjak]|uniref:Uncharacterized protein n=1 Tax=Muntiacus muntjak TaxID=9888 RepID=A0A5N3WCM3_MUNMU|nr:hypothetical protein FD754_002222 [Muntiacus muntjak]